MSTSLTRNDRRETPAVPIRGDMAKTGEREPQSHRIAVLVLGMHRSGTSALSRMLSLLGCALPNRIMPSGSANPTGHWESKAVYAFNEEVLDRAGSTWDDWLPVNPGFARSPIWPKLVKRGCAVVREEFDDEPLFVLKDPRICRLTPFWLEILEAEQIDPRIVLPVRNPLEVAHSLVRRDKSDGHYNLLLWLRHVLEAEVATRGRPRVFTTYDDLLADWSGVAGRISEGLDITWPRFSPLSAEEVAGFLASELRHHSGAPASLAGNPAVPPWVAKTWEVLRAWATGKENANDYATLDVIRQAFDAAAPAFARPLLEIQHMSSRVTQFDEKHDVARSKREVPSEDTGKTPVETDGLRHRSPVSESTLRQREREISKHNYKTKEGIKQVMLHPEQEVLNEGDQETFDNLHHPLVVPENELYHYKKEIAQYGHDANVGTEQIILHSERRVLDEDVETTPVDADDLRYRLAVTESTLRQREEEIARYSREIETSAGQADEIARLNMRLADADAWVFRLSNDRRIAEQDAVLARQQIIQAERKLEQAEIARRADSQLWAQESKRLRDAVVEREALLADARQALERANTKTAVIQGKLDERFREIAVLSKLQREHEQERAAKQTENERLRVASVEREAVLAEVRQTLDRANTKIVEIQGKLDERSQEMATLGERERERAESERFRIAAAEREAVLAKTKQALDQANMGMAEIQGKLDERFREIATLSRLQMEQEQTITQAEDSTHWLRDVYRALLSVPWWWHYMPLRWQRGQSAARLRRKGLFDGAAYLVRYPDVAETGMDPLKHYILHGQAEGRLR